MSLTLSANEKLYLFDDVTVDGENFRVQKNGQCVTLTPRAFDVLIFLIENDGHVVEKQEIFDSVWKDTIVTDNALTKIIKEIRHALEDSANHPRYVETVPKRGYRFIGKVKKNSNQNGVKIERTPNRGNNRSNKNPLSQYRQIISPRFVFSKKALALPALGLISILAFAAWFLFGQKAAENSPSTIRSVAVLPFKPLNAESRNESLEIGMAETLITRLGNLKRLTVRPVSAVRKYTNLQQDPVKAGREIQVEAVLDGSIQKSGERVRITVRLISVVNGATLWSDQFDENFTDIFKVQDSIAGQITDAFALQLSKQEKERLARHYTDNPEAYQLYLRGQFLWHRRQQRWTEDSLDYYLQALEKDSNFALAYIGAADAYIMLSGQRKISMREAEAKARPYITKALEIDNTLAQAHNALAELKYQYEYDWSGAEKEFKTAIDLNPNVGWIRQAYGWFLMSLSRFEEAAAQMEKAGELDPSSLTINIGRGRLYYYSRKYDRAIEHFQNILAVEPNEGSARFSLFTTYEQNGMYREAAETFVEIMRRNRAKSEKIEEFQEDFRISGREGCLRKQLETLERKAKTGSIDHYGLANLYVRLGEKDKAFAHLEKVFEMRDPTIIQFKIEPLYDNLRDDPRYVELLRKINLQP